MKTIELAPIKETPEDFEKLEAAIKAIFRSEIYQPLLDALGAQGSTLIENAMSQLVRVIRSGRVRYYRGAFTGIFSSTTTKELRELGAKWDRKSKTFKLQSSELPAEIRAAIDGAEDKMKRAQARVMSKLAEISPEQLSEKLKAAKFFDTAMWRVDQKFEKQVAKIAVTPKLTPAARAKIADEYTNNMKLYIKKWSEEEIVELRGRIEKAATSGNRYESIVKTIQKSYGVSQRKAKFLARQETGILMAKFKETRYRDAGSEEYIWRCVHGSPNHPVRPFHKNLDGTRQKWSSPPIIDKNGNRKHPGEDYGCRCSARPLVKF